eukprot:3789564-Karenia_brevis.AAC.1
MRRTAVDEDSKQKKLPAPERQVRLDLLRKRLVPIKLKGDLLPSNSLIDKFVAFADSGELRHIKWSELTKRDQEVAG